MAEYIYETARGEHMGRGVDIRARKRERIVRCRDCKHGSPFCDSSSYAGKIDCLHFAQWDYYNDEPGIWPVEPDGFCAWGEERDA